MSHTPGPWFVNERPFAETFDGMYLCRTVQNEEGVIAYLPDDFPTSVGSNAHLIAAAPIMYEVLDECEIVLDAMCGVHQPETFIVQLRDRVHAALALAKGAAIATAEGGPL